MIYISILRQISRKGLLLFDAIGTIVVLILFISALWKKKRMEIPKFRVNLLTLKQTVAIRVWITLDLHLVTLICMIIPEEKIMVFEMFKQIILDNLFYRFLFPLFLLFTNKKKLPQLWSERSNRRQNFFMSGQEEKLPRNATDNFGNPGKDYKKAGL